MEPKYPHLHLSDWPFRTVPDEKFCTFMADRENVRNDIAKLLRNLTRKTVSSMHLQFAWYGCGKTHTLRYIKYLCKNNSNQVILPVYMEFPKNVKGFIDLYYSFMKQIDLNIIMDEYKEVFSDAVSKERAITIFSDSYSPLLNILALLYRGDRITRETIIEWLRGGQGDSRILKSIGLGKIIEKQEEAINILSALIHLIGLREPSKKILWMIDEFQRINMCKENVREDVYSCLASTFNKCPDYLAIYFSTSTSSLEIPKEIADRIGMEKIITLPPLTEDESIIFIRELLLNYRPPEDDIGQNLYFPFTEESVREVIRIIINKGGQLKPRTLMQAFNVVLEETEDYIKRREKKEIDIKDVQDALVDREILDKTPAEEGW